MQLPSLTQFSRWHLEPESKLVNGLKKQRHSSSDQTPWDSSWALWHLCLCVCERETMHCMLGWRKYLFYMKTAHMSDARSNKQGRKKNNKIQAEKSAPHRFNSGSTCVVFTQRWRRDGRGCRIGSSLETSRRGRGGGGTGGSEGRGGRPGWGGRAAATSSHRNLRDKKTGSHTENDPVPHKIKTLSVILFRVSNQNRRSIKEKKNKNKEEETAT